MHRAFQIAAFIAALITTSYAHNRSLAEAPARKSRCLPRCTEFGTCNEELGRCDCPKHMRGEDCSTPADERTMNIWCARMFFPTIKDCVKETHSCLNYCNQRGRCVSGFCHCNPGFYGADCSLSLDEDGKPQLLAGSGYQTRKKRPWVYVYELPPELTSWMNYRRLDRPTHNLIWQRLLSSGSRIADGDKADIYYLPIRQRGMGDQKLLPAAIEYIKHTWPWWNKTQGHRHTVIHTGDLGMREAGLPVMALAENMTWLTHWGLYKYHEYADWDAAHRIGRDVVIPVYVSPGHFKHFGMIDSPLHYNYNQSQDVRSETFFFAGRICGDRKQPDPTKPWPNNCGHPRGYSAGVRQAVHYYHHNRTGYKVVLHERRYDKALKRTKFCLAPLGGGHGQRQIIVTFMGCLPVTIGDHVLQPFEPELDWTQFGLQPAEKDVPILHELLDAINDAKLARMQRALKCAAQHMVYSSITGGFMGESGKYDAFETLLEVLRMKVDHPGVDPKDYSKVDKDFKRFMACGADELGDEVPEEPHPARLCSHSPLDGPKPPTCYRCLLGSSITHGVPGGAMCCGTTRDLSKCPRQWE